MRLSPNPEALAEQLYLLTLATEQALARDDFEESNALFARRDEILTRLESLTLTPETIRRLGEVQLLESEFALRLKDWRSSLVDQLAAEQRGQRATGAYSSKHRRAGFEFTG